MNTRSTHQTLSSTGKRGNGAAKSKSKSPNFRLLSNGNVMKVGASTLNFSKQMRGGNSAFNSSKVNNPSEKTASLAHSSRTSKHMLTNVASNVSSQSKVINYN